MDRTQTTLGSFVFATASTPDTSLYSEPLELIWNDFPWTLDDNFAPDADAWNSYLSRGGRCAARLGKHLVAKHFSLLDTAIFTPIDSWLD